MKISLGCGEEIEQGEDWLNVDFVKLPGVDVVHNLMNFPWPFEDSSVDYIKAKDLLEHLDNYVYEIDPVLALGGVFKLKAGQPAVIAFIEECYRILKSGGTLWIQTPGWKADFLWIDPTHVRGFDVRSMDFFDPDTDFGRSTGFYSEAKFKVDAIELENHNVQFSMVKL